MQNCGSQFQLINLQHNFSTQGSLWKRKQNFSKSLGNREFAGIVSPRNFRNYTHEFSPTWLPKHYLNKKNTNIRADMDVGKLVFPLL